MPYPPAYMGYIGFVKIADRGLRATSCELKLTQAIEKPEVVSSKFDYTVYKLGPKEVGGTIGFPAVLETGGAASTYLIPFLWGRAITRTQEGYLVPFVSQVKYTSDNAGFTFNNCVINTLRFTVAHGELVNMEIDVIGTDREQFINSHSTFLTFAQRNARAVTWNDVILVVQASVGGSMNGTWIRNFECNVNNNVERFYTMNRKLAPQDIAPKLREITGTMTVMGRNTVVAELALANENRCYETSNIVFGYNIFGICNTNWGVRLEGCVFEIEQMSLRNDLMESTINWHCLPGGDSTEDFVVSNIGIYDYKV